MLTEDRERQVEVLKAVDYLLHEREAWAKAPEDSVTLALEEAVDQAMESFAAGPVPATCAGLERIVADAMRWWREWKDQVRDTGLVRILPKDDFWTALKALDELRQSTRLSEVPRLESVKLLTEQKVPNQQICLIYGWLDEAGRPEYWKIEEELAQPGKHTGPESGWVNPMEARRNAEKGQRLAAAEKVAKMIERKLRRSEESCPETVEDLVKQGVSAEQIALMARMTVPAVLAECDRLGLPRPKPRETIHSVKGLHDRDLGEAEERTFAAEQANLTRPGMVGRPAPETEPEAEPEQEVAAPRRSRRIPQP